MDKWTTLVFIVFILIFFGSLTIHEFHDKIEMAKAGLEECPIGDSHVRTIWVKDCIKYKESEKK